MRGWQEHLYHCAYPKLANFRLSDFVYASHLKNIITSIFSYQDFRLIFFTQENIIKISVVNCGTHARYGTILNTPSWVSRIQVPKSE